MKQIPCTSCGAGHYEEITTRYKITAADDVEVVIPKVKVLRCPKCGDELIPPETQKQIDQAVAEQTEQLSKKELEDIAESFALDQTRTSEVLGLGSKTFHRWLNGTQYPSRSMGFYLRVLAEFPEAFVWLRERSWRKRNRIFSTQGLNLAVRFPDLARLSQENRAMCDLNQDNLLEAENKRFNPVTFFTRTKIV